MYFVSTATLRSSISNATGARNCHVWRSDIVGDPSCFYQFHMAFSYRYRNIEETDVEKFSKEIGDVYKIIFEKLTYLKLNPARLCYYYDMLKFIPWNGVQEIDWV
eukprot:TRINITY_DN4609_c0_g1_i1.p1 TRINITY_DN4609_c0_g1~~TRINITY_DN4609_c0_g1_i1.p1  ORF type:complete len:105 (-),score=9.80 TRINITY_DN4609_c0_g1_i1:104-418(-)